MGRFISRAPYLDTRKIDLNWLTSIDDLSSYGDTALNCYQLSSKDFQSSADWEEGSRKFVGTVCPLDPLSETHVAHHATTGNLRVRFPLKKRHPMIWTVYSECLFHEDLIHTFRTEAFSGFELRDATVRFGDGSVESEL